MAENDLIGCLQINYPNRKDLLPQFNRKSKSFAVFADFYSSKKYGATMVLHYDQSFRDRLDEAFGKIEDKEKNQAASRRIKKVLDSGKCVDTSKWVKADELSLKRELIQHLFMLLVYRPETLSYEYHRGKADALYSVIHCHNPKNPQVLYDFHFEPLEAIMTELNGTMYKQRLLCTWVRMPKGKVWPVRNHKQAIARFKSWTATSLKEMITLKNWNGKGVTDALDDRRMLHNIRAQKVKK